MTTPTTAADIPVASFVVEREVGRGYRVTRSDGAQAGHLADSALAILDILGQPDPRAPETVVRWLRPDQAFGYPVEVRVTRLSNGEVRYEQTWFPASAKPRRPTLWVAVCLLLGGISGIVAGCMFERYRAASVPTPPPPVGLVESQRELRDIQDAVSHAQKQMSRLINTLEKQPPHIPDLENADVAAKTTVVIEKKTVLGVEDRSSVLHFAPETFDTEETSRLLALLRRLQELQHNAQEPSEQSGTPSPDSGARHSPATDRQPAGNP